MEEKETKGKTFTYNQNLSVEIGKEVNLLDHTFLHHGHPNKLKWMLFKFKTKVRMHLKRLTRIDIITFKLSEIGDIYSNDTT